MKIVDDVPEPSQTSQEALQATSKPSPIDEGYHLIEGLPSALKLYPEGTRIYGRPLKVLEVKQLASINENNADNIINSIIRRAVKGIETDKILVADKLFILLWLRGTTYPDPTYGIHFQCDTCKKDSKYDFTLDKIETKQIDDKFTLDKLVFTLPNKDELTFAFPTIAEEKQSDSFKANLGSNIPDLDSDIVSQSVLIKKINGENKSMLEKYNYLATLQPSDYCYFLSYVERWSFGIKWIINVDCKDCGATSQIGAIFLSDPNFWLPRVSKDII